MKPLSNYNQEILKDKLLSRTDTQHPSGCWIWNGPKNPKGYGQIGMRPGALLTHRISYHLFKGPIPEGMMICHSCDNPSCVNPNHLFAGTAKDNASDMVKKGRHNYGEKSPAALLSEDAVLSIRKRWASRLTITKLAKEYGLTVPAITSAIYGKSWKHIPNIRDLNAESTNGWTLKK